MTTKHTPGPWEFDDKHSSAFPLLCLYAADSKSPFHGTRSDAEQNANARLIAAAPELLEALEQMLRVATRNDVSENEQIEIADRALTVIQKARGAA